MFLISVKCEYENKIKEKLKTLYNKKITIFTENDILEHNKYKNYQYVITDYNKDVIDYFLSKKKKVIVFENEIEGSMHKDKNLYYCSNINDINEIIKEKGINNRLPVKIAFSLMILLTLVGILTVNLQNINNLDKEKEVKNENTVKVDKTTKKSPKSVDQKTQNYLFLGDSITEFYNLEDYYDDTLPVVNSGIAGNKTYDILGDMENRVYKYNPTKVFLLVGTNDLSHKTDYEIISNIISIVEEIHKHRKNAEVYVESIYPVNNKTEGNDKVVDWMVGDRDNERIREINKRLENNSKGYDYTYLDFYSLLEDEEQSLKLEYTVDGLHISDEGYKIITKEIMKIIEGESNE